MTENKTTKFCPKCQTTKPVAEFDQRSKSDARLRSHCQACRKVEQAAYREANREKVRAAVAACYEDPEKRAKYRETAKVERAAKVASDLAFRLREAARKAEWAKANPDKVREGKVRAVQKNPHRSRDYEARRRARLLQVPATLTSEEWAAVLDFYNHSCFYCGSPAEGETIQLDHIVPVSKGGHHVASNVVPACPSCNRRKSAKDPLVFLFQVRDGFYN